MKRMFIKMLPVMAAVLLATSCGKDDGNDAAIDNPIDTPQQTEPVTNAYKTVTISGKVGKATLSKVTVADSKLAFQVDDKFSFGEEGKDDVYGDITIKDADGKFEATLNYSSVKALTSADCITATLGNLPEGLGTAYETLEDAVQNAYYEIPFIVTGSDVDGYKLTEPTQSKADVPTYDVKVYVRTAFIRAQGTRTIKMNNKDVNVEIGHYYVVPAGAQMGSNPDNKTVAGKVYNVKKLAGGIKYAKTYVGKNEGDDSFTNALTQIGDGSVSYSSSNTNVATIGNDGNVTINGLGKATITATVSADTEGFTYAEDANTATYTLVVAPEDCIPGLFSVSATEQVFFSKGNLQYNVRTYVWRFAGNQYDYVGNDNRSNQGPWIDLFGWVGITGSLDGAATKYGVSTEKNASCYGNWVDEPLKSDWGKVFGEDSPWRTLTGGDRGEWLYLIDGRITTSGVRFARANVAGVNGLIILPDDWKNESPCNLASYNESNADYASNKISSENWESWETAGAVFLPAAGYRDGTNVKSVRSLGGYWSSSANGTNVAFAFGLYFSSGSDPLAPAGSAYRYYGESVRLVRPL